MISQQRLSRKFCQIFSKVTLQPWTSDAEGENWEETSQRWAGPCEGKSVQLQQLLEELCGDVQAAVFRMAADISRLDFGNVAQYRNMIRRIYALPVLFMELDQLLVIISCPKSTSQNVATTSIAAASRLTKIFFSASRLASPVQPSQT